MVQRVFYEQSLLDDLSINMNDMNRQLENPRAFYNNDLKDYILTTVVNDYIDSGKYRKANNEYYGEFCDSDILDNNEYIIPKGAIIPQQTRDMLKIELENNYNMWVNYFVSQKENQNKAMEVAKKQTQKQDKTEKSSPVFSIILCVIAALLLIVAKIGFGIVIFAISVLYGFLKGTMKQRKKHN